VSNRLRNIVAFLKSNLGNLLVIWVMLSVSFVLLYRFIPPFFTIQMVTRMILDKGDFTYTYVPYHKISPSLKVCAIAAEDQNFPFHYGVDVEAIEKAIKRNQKRRKTFGASTISQQVAKNVFLFPARNIFRKGLELYFTLLIETLWSKEKILEVYLNVAEMGTLTFGAQAASTKFFGKNAASLTLTESAAIIAALPNPRKYIVNKPKNYLAKRQRQIQSLYHQLDGSAYLRELNVRSEKSLYDFSKYRK
jgi:monofunctional biosynthetic peptidoglycan transglycosylase